MTPLAILLEVMLGKWAAGDHDGAVALARAAAPYIHPRIPPARPATDLATITDADLDAVQCLDGMEAPTHDP